MHPGATGLAARRVDIIPPRPSTDFKSQLYLDIALRRLKSADLLRQQISGIAVIQWREGLGPPDDHAALARSGVGTIVEVGDLNHWYRRIGLNRLGGDIYIWFLRNLIWHTGHKPPATTQTSKPLRDVFIQSMHSNIRITVIQQRQLYMIEIWTIRGGKQKNQEAGAHRGEAQHFLNLFLIRPGFLEPVCIQLQPAYSWPGAVVSRG